MISAGKGFESSLLISGVIRWRLWILTFWCACIFASALVYHSKFEIDNSVAIWFLEDDPELEDYRHYNSEFGEREWTYLWLRGDTVFSPEFLRELRLLSDRIGAIENVTRVVSLTEAGSFRVGLEDKIFFDEFYAAEVGELLDERQVVALREGILSKPERLGRFVPKGDEQFTILAVQSHNHIDAIEPYRIQFIDEIREAASSFPTILEFGLVGTAVINSELNRAAKRDMLIYYILIAAFVLVGGGLALRSVRDLVVLCAVVLGTVFPVMGCIAALDLPFNLITVMLPTLLVTVSVSYLIHFISEFHAKLHEQVEGGERHDIPIAISATFRRLVRPGLWTSVTTAIGFASLTVSSVAPIRQVGFFAAAGIVLAWLNTVTVAPALLSLLWRNPDDSPHRVSPKGKVGGKILLSWLQRPHPMLALFLGSAMLAGAGGLVWLEADTDYVKFFRPGSKVRSDYAQLEKLGMPSSYLTVIVRQPNNLRFPNLDRHRSMLSFEESLLTLPGALDVQSLDKVAEQFASDLGGGDASREALPFLRIFELVLAKSGNILGADEFRSEDGRLLQLRVMTSAMSTRDIEEFRVGLDRLAADLPVRWNVSLTGTNVLWANMDAHVVRTQLLSIGITAAVLLVLLPFVFRSLALGIFGFVVSFVPVLCTLGLMGWLDLPVNIATCILGGVVIGLAVDDTIYFLSRFRDSRLLGMPVDDSLRRATWTTGRAMIKTSLILTGGFLTMTASDFMPSVYFGIFFAFSILIALLADLIVLPALLRLVYPATKAGAHG